MSSNIGEMPHHIDTFLDADPHKYLTRVCGYDSRSLDYACEGIDFVLNALPFVRCEETKEGVIRVSGFWARNLDGEIYKQWRSQRVNDSIFIDLTARTFTFHKFFALEVLYILQVLKSKARNLSVSTINDIQKTIYESTWVGKLDNAPPLRLNYSRVSRELNVKLLDSQNNFLKAYAENTVKLNLNGMMLAAPPGTGKTIAGCAFSLAVDADVTFFIVPKNSLEQVWEKTIRTRFKKIPSYWISTKKGSPTGKERYIICHYEALERILPIVRKVASKKVAVWLDESHNFNEFTSLRTQRFVDLCKDTRAEHVVWASGTPLKAIGKEAVPMLTTIDPLFTEEVKKKFVGLFGVTTGRALDVLNHRLSKLSFKVPKKEVIDTPKEEYTIKVSTPTSHNYTLDKVKEAVRLFVEERLQYYKQEMPRIISETNAALDFFESTLRTPEDKANFFNYRSQVDTLHKRFDMDLHKDWLPLLKKYEKEVIEPELSMEERKKFRKNISRYKYIVLVIRGEALGLVVTKMRIDAIRSMVDYVPFKSIIDGAEKKTLIFTSYVDVANSVRDRLKGEGYDPLLVYGGTNKDLMSILNKLKNDPKANPIIATYPSLSTAVEIIECNTTIFIDVPFRDHIMQQAKARTDRLGQDSKVHYVSVLLDTSPHDNITTRSLDIMEWSRGMVNSMMGTPGLEDEPSEMQLEKGIVSMESINTDTFGDVLDELIPSSQDESVCVMEEMDKRDVWYANVFEARTKYLGEGRYE